MPKGRPKSKAKAATSEKEAQSQALENDLTEENRQLKEQNAAMSENMKSMQEMMGALSEKVEKLSETPNSVRASHDPNRRIMGDVLGEEERSDGLPPKPEPVLPPKLRRVQKAINNPTQIRQAVESHEEPVGQYQERVMKSTGPAHESLEPLREVDEGIAMEGSNWTKEKFEKEAFMHEWVLLEVLDTGDDTMAPIVELSNGDHTVSLRPGDDPKWIQRKFVEPLARAKKTTYTQRKMREPTTGIDTMVEVPHTTPLWPYRVLEDTPKGKEWLKQILREPY